MNMGYQRGMLDIFEPIGGKFVVWLFHYGGSNAFYIDYNKRAL